MGDLRQWLSRHRHRRHRYRRRHRRSESEIERKMKDAKGIYQKKDKQQRDQQPWQPTKRVSRTTMEKIRSLAASYPGHYNSVSLAAEFRISPEAVKRILKSKFRPEPSIADRQEKNRYAAMGVRKQQIQSKSINFSGISSSASDEGSPPPAIEARPPHHSRKNKYSQSPTSSSSPSSSSLDRRWNSTPLLHRLRRIDHDKGTKS
ncbi:hypothetical protein [Absidia glauca]|uniref:Required for respiratory growth protein 9, mitochondrial n=1 Tax=Absidia glauca TaxID=4829 RepID=A0A168QKW3_ABSGL|nr:hypothetical protein [Absidia glauca]